MYDVFMTRSLIHLWNRENFTLMVQVMWKWCDCRAIVTVVNMIRAKPSNEMETVYYLAKATYSISPASWAWKVNTESLRYILQQKEGVLLNIFSIRIKLNTLITHRFQFWSQAGKMYKKFTPSQISIMIALFNKCDRHDPSYEN